MNIRQIIKEELDNSLRETIIPDLFKAVENSKEAKGIYNPQGDICAEGNIYDYYISYEVTQRPQMTGDNGDYWTPPSWELSGDFDFDITEIPVYTKDGDDVCDALKLITKEEYAKLKEMLDFDLYELAYSKEDWDEMNEPDWDAMRKDNLEENKIKLTENDITGIVKRIVNEVSSKRTIINRIYKVTHDITGHLYHDENWHGVTLVVDAIESLGYDCEVTVKDGGYRSNPKDPFGLPWKEYLLRIETPEGFEINGTLNCHSAGTTEDPFDRYDMSLVMW